MPSFNPWLVWVISSDCPFYPWDYRLGAWAPKTNSFQWLIFSLLICGPQIVHQWSITFWVDWLDALVLTFLWLVWILRRFWYLVFYPNLRSARWCSYCSFYTNLTIFLGNPSGTCSRATCSELLDLTILQLSPGTPWIILNISPLIISCCEWLQPARYST